MNQNILKKTHEYKYACSEKNVKLVYVSISMIPSYFASYCCNLGIISGFFSKYSLNNFQHKIMILMIPAIKKFKLTKITMDMYIIFFLKQLPKYVHKFLYISIKSI